MPRVIALSFRGTASGDDKLLKMIAFWGPEVGIVPAHRDVLDRAGTKIPAPFVLHADVIPGVDAPDDFVTRLRVALQNGAHVLIHGLRPGPSSRCLESLTGGYITGVGTQPSSSAAHLPQEGKEFSKQLAAVNIPRRSRDKEDSVFILAAGRSANDGPLPLITLSGNPSFVCVPVGTGRLFLTTTDLSIDPNENVHDQDELKFFYEPVVTLLMFLRFACGIACWHSASPPSARLIIDDPVLREHYGFLDFNHLFSSMEQHNYAATIAYIPWNYKRTNRRQANFFNERRERYGICIHGCDHINNEYGTANTKELFHKSQLAMDRMQTHQHRTQVLFDSVMVFPQGRFSEPGLRTLRSCKFLGAVNSSPFPVDKNISLSLGNLLLPARSGSAGFPIFGRHYVRDSCFLFLDLFLGRPAFIVEHHGFFESGFPILEEVVDRLNQAEPNLSWMPLNEILGRAAWQRSISHEEYEVRFFTDKFAFTNTAARKRSYRFWKLEPDQEATASVQVNQQPFPMQQADGKLQSEVYLEPGQTISIAVSPSVLPVATYRTARSYPVKVFVRRALSEFRDEVLVKHPALLAPAKSLVRLMKASADSSATVGGDS